MAIGITIFIVAALVMAIWVVVELKRVRHKIFALFLIGLILFLYFSSSFVFKEKEVDFQSISGITSAVQIYFSWLGSVFVNLKTITSNAIDMNWKGNKSIG